MSTPVSTPVSTPTSPGTKGPRRPLPVFGTGRDQRRPAPGSGALTAAVIIVTVGVGLAFVLQTSVFPHLAWRGVGPDLVLLVVVAGALARGAHFGMVLGFAAGLLVDLAPPADHVAGRWTLALLLVGYVAGRVRQDAPAGVGGALAAVAACSFLGSSVFALTGVALQDQAAAVPDLLRVVLVGVVWDVALAAFVLPVVAWALGRFEPDGLPAR